MTGRLVSGIAHEIREMLPPTIFFMVCFNLLVLTLNTLSPEVRDISHASATVGALLIGKAALLAELLPFLHRYAKRPVIYAGSVEAGLASDLVTFNWDHFWIVQMWLAILLLVYMGFQDLVRAVGSDKVARLFFRDGAAVRPDESSSTQ